MVLRDAVKLAPDDAEICYQYAVCCDETMRQEDGIDALIGWPRMRGLTTGLLAKIGLLLMKRVHWIGTTLRARPIEQKAAVSQRFIAEMIPLFESGLLRPVIDSRFALDDIVSAHRHMEANANVGKILIDL